MTEEQRAAYQKRIENELYQQKQDLKALIEDSPDIIARFDRDLRHVYINGAIEKVTGIAPESFIGKTNKELHIPDGEEAVWSTQLERIFHTGKEQRGEYHFYIPNQEMRSYQVRFVPEFSQDGEMQYVLSIAHDISREKELDLAKDEFISLVSHELRTP